MERIILFILLSLFSVNLFASHSFSQSPVGYWKVIDKQTHQPSSIIRISQLSNDKLMGQIIKTFPENNHSLLCTHCIGKEHNQPLLGMIILSELNASHHAWHAGKWLNPSNGKTSQCSLHLAENGNKLNIENFFGLPIFGQSETWERVDLMSGKE